MAAAAAVGLTIDPAYRAGVIAAFASTQQMAQSLMEFPLAEEADAASVFVP